MLISHRHRFIFFHCRKTAGSSVSAYLNRFLGPWDQQIGAWRDIRRQGGGYNLRFWADITSDRLGATLVRALAGAPRHGWHPALAAAQQRIYRRRLGALPTHATAAMVRAFAPEAFATYFKFCFVRDPYDRVYSDYLWRLGVRGLPPDAVSFRDFLLRSVMQGAPDPEGLVSARPDNWPIYTIDDRIAVDRVGRFETLHDDLAEICTRIGLPFDPTALPHTKRSAAGTGYRQHYGEAEARLVGQLCAKEIEAFGYRF